MIVFLIPISHIVPSPPAVGSHDKCSISLAEDNLEEKIKEDAVPIRPAHQPAQKAKVHRTFTFMPHNAGHYSTFISIK